MVSCVVEIEHVLGDIKKGLKEAAKKLDELKRGELKNKVKLGPIHKGEANVWLLHHMGLTTREIAEKLGIKPTTVRGYRGNVRSYVRYLQEEKRKEREKNWRKWKL